MRLRSLVAVMGACWAVVAWSLWPLSPHRGNESALASAIWLVPSYLLLTAVRGWTIPMQVFVVSAALILILVGFRVIPGRYDVLWFYIWCPIWLALGTVFLRWLWRELSGRDDRYWRKG